jgi:hypothetical protein
LIREREMTKDSISYNAGLTNDERRESKEMRQASFLRAYRKIGTRSGAFRVAKITKKNYDWWMRTEPDFMREVSEARHEFGEYLEEIALERVKNPDKNRGSDVLLLGLLNANLPQKFRPQFAMGEDSAKDLIIEWRKAAQSIKRGDGAEAEREELPVGVERTLTELLEKRRDAPEQSQDNKE